MLHRYRRRSLPAGDPTKKRVEGESIAGHAYTVRAPLSQEYEAVCELAKAVGIDLMDG
jgi:hypothetical protein